VKDSSEVTEARNENLLWMSLVVNPGVPRGTRNPRTPSSVLAHTVAMSAMPPLVIHIFEPLRIQSPPSRRAFVRMSAGLEPKSGSVRPKQPTASLWSGCFAASGSDPTQPMKAGVALVDVETNWEHHARQRSAVFVAKVLTAAPSTAATSELIAVLAAPATGLSSMRHPDGLRRSAQSATSTKRPCASALNGHEIARWVRATSCFQRSDQSWLITHEHVHYRLILRIVRRPTAVPG
jgi:hypothetical protein